jgi:hypothetical protein
MYICIGEMLVNMFLDRNLHHYTHHDIGIYFGVDMEFCFFTVVVDLFPIWSVDVATSMLLQLYVRCVKLHALAT